MIEGAERDGTAGFFLGTTGKLAAELPGLVSCLQLHPYFGILTTRQPV